MVPSFEGLRTLARDGTLPAYRESLVREEAAIGVRHAGRGAGMMMGTGRWERPSAAGVWLLGALACASAGCSGAARQAKPAKEIEQAPASAPAAARAPSLRPADGRASGSQPFAAVAPASETTSSQPASLPLAALAPSACDRAYDHIETLSVAGLDPAEAAAHRRELEVNRSPFDDACAASADAATTECILEAATLDDAAQCGAGRHGASTAPAPQGPPPDERECRRAFDHLEALTLAQLPKTAPAEIVARARAGVEARRDEVMHACLTDGSEDTVACILRAKSIDQADRCGGQ